MNRLTIFGTIEFEKSQFKDEEESPKYIGGNGIIASRAAAKIVDVDLIGVVGTDMDKDFLAKSLGTRISTKNVTQLIGNSFRWKAIYDKKTQELIDQDITFGVYAEYKPIVNYKKTDRNQYVLFSGSKPQLSIKVLEQLDTPAFVTVDVLLYHLEHNYDASIDLIQKADVLFVNDKEYTVLVQKHGKNLFRVFRNLKYIFHKQGEKGVTVITPNKKSHFVPEKVVKPLNPANAGDAFSCTMVGQLVAGKDLQHNLDEIVHAAIAESIKVMMNDQYYRLPYNMSILDTIILEKNKEIRNLKDSSVLKNNRTTEVRDFYHAIKKKNIALIAEIKKASPSAGVIRLDFNHNEIAKIYQKSGKVDAISVLTDKKFFQGDLSFIRDVKKITSCPIFRKDFIINKLQVLESYISEADALLLIVAVLKPDTLRDLISYTEELGMNALVEVHTPEECKIAIESGAKIIGINARNLKNFEVDMNLFETIAQKIPEGILKVAESGIESRHDIEKMYNAGADAVLVGTSIMKQRNISKFLNSLRGGIHV
jgi:indole-3-glycerol phosphate synthase